MRLGWDPIDELEDNSPTPAWANWVAVILFALMTITAVFHGF